MRLLLRRREGGSPAAQADAEALIRDYGAEAYRNFLDGSARVLRELRAVSLPLTGRPEPSPCACPTWTVARFIRP
jgi:hypothetical protein